MEEFSIKGNGNFIKVAFDEVYGFPGKTSSWGGYEVLGTIQIKSRGFQVKAPLYTSTGEIYEFYEQLKQRNEQLNGVVYYRTFEENLDLKLEYDDLGHINVFGVFSEQNQFANELKVEFIIDQTYLYSTLIELKAIADKYGDMKGVNSKLSN